MYLKNIEVQGFKSFAQKINFEFHNGITGIVGPNGSGKSNVGDAVRWVLGEQSAKQLRGGNMQDVIFSGTELRKPLSFASVAITLDNSDHKLPVDFEEVTVTRRLYRSGESEYRINGSSCRLKDINEMFYDTGIGKEGYSIIGQGQIDKILSGKPEERRELFDEAAGIVKFKRRKNTTLKKLDEEQQNLVRVTDILSELTKQLEPLERQSETAKIYLAKRENLKELDINMFLLEYEHTGNLIRELEEKTRIAENQLKEAQDAHSRTKDEYERLEKILEELNERMEALREESRDRAIRKQQLSGEINVLHEQILAGEQNDSHYRSRLLAVQEDTEKKSADQKALEEQKADLQANLREIDRKLADEQKKMDNIQSSIEECTQAVEDGKNEIIEILNSRANTKGKAQRFDAMKEQLDIRKAGISQRILSLKTQEEEQQSAIDQAQKEYDTITKAIQETREEGSRLTKEIHAIQETLKQQNTQLEKEQTSYHREASRLESLRNITERYDGYGNSIRRVMEQKNHVPGIRGVVADIIHVEKNYEIAIETALGGSIQNIVTDNEQTAKQMIEFLKKNRYGRATFLPLNSISSRGEFNQRGALNEPGAIGLASGLVTAEKEYDGLIGYLLGRVLVVDHIDHAIAIARKYRHSIRMVTLEGESLSPGGSMTGGAFKNNSNLLGRRREIEELEKKVKELAAGYNEIRQSMEDNRSRRNEMRDTVAALQQKFQEQSIQQNTARLNIEQLEKKAEEIRGGYTRIEREQEEIRLQARDMQADNIKITQELEASKRDEEELETFIETRQKELEDWKKDEAETSEKLERIRLDASASQQKESFIKENLRRLKEEIEVLSKEREEILDSLEKGSQETAEKRKTIDKVRKEIEGFAAKEEVAAKQLEKWQQEKEERTKSHK
ncbi:MAG: chromosome segregation protein SMC, partial [Ruminococcus sp.]|nr:chromosome segregation protein SMC [Ruminococcus sp.]